MPNRFKLLRSILLPTFITIVLIVLLSGCGPRMDGSSEPAFKESFKIMKNRLSKTDTAKLNAAIKVIGFSIMGQQMDNNPTYAGKSLNAILIKKLDGKTYGGIIAMAEDSLKTGKQREIVFVQKQISELQAGMHQRKAAYDALKNKLSIIQGRLVKIDMHGGEPVIYCEFKNVSLQQLDHFSLSIVARSISKKSLVVTSTQFYGGVKTLSHNDTLMLTVPISTFNKGQAPEVPLDRMKYPITNANAYNLNVEAYADEIKIDDHDYDLSTVKWGFTEQDEYDKKYKELSTRLKEAQSRTENLDDIE